ncbi:MAG: hypothetical protein JWN52_780 [Actinomycetia bacterium]|nr:hypothetical protein [Actinomycetes bacterium]
MLLVVAVKVRPESRRISAIDGPPRTGSEAPKMSVGIDSVFYIGNRPTDAE